VRIIAPCLFMSQEPNGNRCHAIKYETFGNARFYDEQNVARCKPAIGLKLLATDGNNTDQVSSVDMIVGNRHRSMMSPVDLDDAILTAILCIVVGDSTALV